jgi:hypothetical protein
MDTTNAIQHEYLLDHSLGRSENSTGRKKPNSITASKDIYYLLVEFIPYSAFESGE